MNVVNIEHNVKRYEPMRERAYAASRQAKSSFVERSLNVNWTLYKVIKLQSGNQIY